jgi:protein-tyrosine phosphatase
MHTPGSVPQVLPIWSAGGYAIRSARSKLQRMTKVLLVCLANVCRSPMACAVATAIARQRLPKPRGWRGFFVNEPLKFRSAGLHAGMAGAPMDPRARDVLLNRGYEVSKERSRRLVPEDFVAQDLILAMDQAVLKELRRQCPAEQQHKVRLFLDFTPSHKGRDVPDPYFGDMRGFEHVLDLCELGSRALLDTIGANVGA